MPKPPRLDRPRRRALMAPLAWTRRRERSAGALDLQTAPPAEPAVRRTEGQAAADVDGVLGMMTADDGAAERRGAMVMAANVVLVAVSDRSISGVAPP